MNELIDTLHEIAEQLDNLQMTISLHADSQYSNELCLALSEISERLKEVDYE